MSQLKTVLAVLLVIGLVFAVSGCKKKSPQTEPPAQPAATPAPEPTPEPTPVPPPPFEPPTETKPIKEPSVVEIQSELRTVYFDFDKSDLSDATRRALRENAQVLMQYGKYNVVIEGHCDERGSIEYNLALGERRARGVREFLGTLGVNASRMRIKTFGEEQPAVRGSNESAWAKNRRAEFKLEQ